MPFQAALRTPVHRPHPHPVGFPPPVQPTHTPRKDPRRILPAKQILLPLSRYYPDLAFVNSELCLDDRTVLSVYTRRKRQFQWDPPAE
jgi:hypothetical protein